jgi:hypothetical protein
LERSDAFLQGLRLRVRVTDRITRLTVTARLRTVAVVLASTPFDSRVAARALRDDGVVTIPGAFADAAPALADLVRRHVERRFGITEQDPSSWNRPCNGAISTRRFRHTERFDAVLAPPVRDVLDETFGTGVWTGPPSSARVLVTPPRRDAPWKVPNAFHFDVPLDRLAWPGDGVLLFSFLADTEPGGGGTCVVAGTHRLVDTFVGAHRDLPIDRRMNVFLRQQGDWLRQLVNQDDGDPDRAARCFNGVAVAGVPLRVIELTGKAGDVVVTHCYTLHSPSPNTSDRMRLMVSTAIGANGRGFYRP